MLTPNAAIRPRPGKGEIVKRLPLPLRLVLALLLLLIPAAPAVWAGLEHQETKEISYSVLPVPAVAAASQPIVGKLDSALDGHPRITLAAESESGKPSEFQLSSDTEIVLNGSPATLADLQSGDEIKLSHVDGRTIINATRSKSTIVLGASGNAVNMTTDYMDKFSLALGKAAQITLNDKPASLADLKKGDHASIICAKDGTISAIHISRQPLFMQF